MKHAALANVKTINLDAFLESNFSRNNNISPGNALKKNY